MNTYNRPTKAVICEPDGPSPFPYGMEIRQKEITVLEASDKELLNEAYRRGLISRFNTTIKVDRHVVKEYPEVMLDCMKEATYDISHQVLAKNGEKGFIDVDNVEDSTGYSPFIIPTKYEMYICSHPVHVRKTRRG